MWDGRQSDKGLTEMDNKIISEMVTMYILIFVLPTHLCKFVKVHKVCKICAFCHM